MTTSPSDALDSPPAAHAATRSARRLRLVGRADSLPIRELDAFEATYCAYHEELLRSLAGVEAALADDAGESARGADEQIAFIRVGLRCIADAIGELNANVTDLAIAHAESDSP